MAANIRHADRASGSVPVQRASVCAITSGEMTANCPQMTLTGVRTLLAVIMAVGVDLECTPFAALPAFGRKLRAAHCT